MCLHSVRDLILEHLLPLLILDVQLLLLLGALHELQKKTGLNGRNYQISNDEVRIMIGGKS